MRCGGCRRFSGPVQGDVAAEVDEDQGRGGGGGNRSRTARGSEKEEREVACDAIFLGEIR